VELRWFGSRRPGALFYVPPMGYVLEVTLD
jgi:hypothetical protein